MLHHTIIPLSQSKLVILACNSHSDAWLPYAARVIKLQHGEITHDGEPDTIIHSQQAMNKEVFVNNDVIINKSNKKQDNDTNEKTSSYATYVEYMRACGYVNLLLAVICTLCSYSASTYSDYLLSFWTAEVITTSQVLVAIQ